jgi:hypothetical protein
MGGGGLSESYFQKVRLCIKTASKLNTFDLSGCIVSASTNLTLYVFCVDGAKGIFILYVGVILHIMCSVHSHKSEVLNSNQDGASLWKPVAIAIRVLIIY